MPETSSKSIRVVLGTLVTFAIVWAVGNSLTAAVVGPGTGFLFGPPVTASATDEARVTVSNIGPAPARVRVFFVKASDFSQLAAGPQTTIAPRSSAVLDQSLVFILDDFPVMVVVRHQSNAATNLKVSLQVTDTLGVTQIFADGFESGNTS